MNSRRRMLAPQEGPLHTGNPPPPGGGGGERRRSSALPMAAFIGAVEQPEGGPQTCCLLQAVHFCQQRGQEPCSSVACSMTALSCPLLALAYRRIPHLLLADYMVSKFLSSCCLLQAVHFCQQRGQEPCSSVACPMIALSCPLLALAYRRNPHLMLADYMVCKFLSSMPACRLTPAHPASARDADSALQAGSTTCCCRPCTCASGIAPDAMTVRTNLQSSRHQYGRGRAVSDPGYDSPMNTTRG